MSGAEEPHLWLADPTVDWRIVLAAELTAPPARDDLERALARLNHRVDGSGNAALAAPSADDTLVRTVAGWPGGAPVTAGLQDAQLVLAGEHQHVDGLGMLAVLTELTGVVASSAARGVGARAQPPFAVEVARRLGEVALRPPARVAPTAGGAAPGGSTFADLLLPRRVGTAELVHAAVRAIGEFNRARGSRARRVAVAVGASAVGGDQVSMADNSALLRLRSAERVDLDGVRTFLRTAPTVPSPGRALEGSTSWLQRAGAAGVRVLGPRLGSTLTVSHLGDVSAEVEALTFYPVAGGPSAVAVGAVTHRGRTRVTARGRADRHSEEGLAEVLTLLSAQLA